MKTMVKEFTVYNFDELSDDAKYRAMDDVEYPWCYENMESLKTFMNLFNIHLTDYSIDLSGGKCSYSYINWSADDSIIMELKYIRLYKYLLNNYEKHINQNCELTGYFMDASLMYHLTEFMKAPYSISGYDLFKKCIEEFKDDYLKDCEGYYSFESFKELSDNNEWLYLEDGSLV